MSYIQRQQQRGMIDRYISASWGGRSFRFARCWIGGNTIEARLGYTIAMYVYEEVMYIYTNVCGVIWEQYLQRRVISLLFSCKCSYISSCVLRTCILRTRCEPPTISISYVVSSATILPLPPLTTTNTISAQNVFTIF